MPYKNKFLTALKTKSPPNSVRKAFSSSGGSVARLSASRVPFWEALLPETRTRYARNAFFIPSRLQEQVLDALEIKNPVHFRTPGFS